MEQTDQHIHEALRGHLESRRGMPVSAEGMDEIPGSIFCLIEPEPELLEINGVISRLNTRQRQLLRYYCEGHDPRLILESLDFESPDQLWLDLAESARLVAGQEAKPGPDPLDSEMKSKILRVFGVHDQLVGRMALILDQMEEEAEKSKKRRRRIWTIFLFPAILVPAILIFYPKVSNPGLAGLYESYSSAYQPDTTKIDTTELVGRDYFDAVVLFAEGDLESAYLLFETVSQSVSPFTTGSYWFLALIALQGQRVGECRQYLELIRMSDPEFFDRYGSKLDKSLK